MELAVKLLHPAARLPRRAHPGDAGADLFSVEEVTIPAGERRDVGTGLALAIPAGLCGLRPASLGSGLQARHHGGQLPRPHRRRLPGRGAGLALQLGQRSRSSCAWGSASPNWWSSGSRSRRSSRRTSCPRRSGAKEASAAAGGERRRALSRSCPAPREARGAARKLTGRATGRRWRSWAACTPPRCSGRCSR